MLLIINIIILIHSTKKKLQKLFKKFTYGLFKVLYGRIDGYKDILKISDSKILISEINNNFKYKIYIIKKANANNYNFQLLLTIKIEHYPLAFFEILGFLSLKLYYFQF